MFDTKQAKFQLQAFKIGSTAFRMHHVQIAEAEVACLHLCSHVLVIV